MDPIPDLKYISNIYTGNSRKPPRRRGCPTAVTRGDKHILQVQEMCIRDSQHPARPRERPMSMSEYN